jgi:hypothetical protein
MKAKKPQHLIHPANRQNNSSQNQTQQHEDPTSTQQAEEYHSKSYTFYPIINIEEKILHP